MLHQYQAHQYPIVTALYRTLAVAAWVAAGILYVFGLHAIPVNQLSPDAEVATPLDFYAAAFLMMLLAMTFTARVAFENLVVASFAREAERSRASLADAVAQALAAELVERGLVLRPDGPDGGNGSDGHDGSREDHPEISRIGRR